MRARSPWTITLVLIILALAAWRASCILAGPDIDTDAYAHHMIARAILADPRDLAVHWVWLPLFHYAQVPLVALGGTMNDVRWINLVLGAALPCLLFAYLRRTARSGDAKIPAEATALLAAVFAGACPIVMQMGTTAQPEPLFAVLILGLAIALEDRRDVAAAAMLSAAVMLRYEAWAVLLVVTALLAIEPSPWGQRLGIARRGAPSGVVTSVGRSAPVTRWVVVAAPALLIGAWAALRRPVDGRWFAFLRQTQDFATDAIRAKGTGEGALASFVRDLLYYPIIVPARVLGPALPLVAFGVVPTIRQQGTRFVLVFAACLGFVSLSWAKHATLGLDRHFVVVVPLYATFAAQGVVVLADAGTRAARRMFAGGDGRVRVGRAIGAALAALSVAGLGVELDVWMGFWRDSIARGLPDRAALGEYLRSVPGAPTIFCDDATLEIQSGLDRRRFDRHWVDDPSTWERVRETARANGSAYVATWRRKMRGHETEGAIVFQAGSDRTDQSGTGVAVMRVEGDGSRSER